MNTDNNKPPVKSEMPVIDVNEPAASAENGAPVPEPVPVEELSPELAALTDDLIGALKSVYDPEIPVDIYELGLIYRVDVSDDRDVTIDMTLTAPGCPVAEHMPRWVEDAVRSVDGVCDVIVNMTFDPPWDPSRMSDEARVALNMF
ncbi:MAG: SUF system Fe-S cluster assembly protein [Parvibaculales bacterium]